MCCTTLFVHPATMATTQLMQALCGAVCWPQQDEKNAEQKPLHMSWVAVTDENGHRQLRTCWRADREN